MIATQTDYGYDLAMTRGDTESLTVTMTVDGTDEPFDAAEAVLTVRDRREGTKLFDVDATSVENGVAVFDFPHALTATLPAGKYVYDVQATTADGVVKTPLGGLKSPCRFTLYQDVTYDG